MSVDVAHTEDWATLLDLGELRAYVLHLALADLSARGFVRPLALALVAPRARLTGSAVHAQLPALARALERIAGALKAPAQAQFEREVAQRIRDLRATLHALRQPASAPSTPSLTPQSVQEALHELLALRPRAAEDAAELELGAVLRSLPRGRFADPLRPLAQLVGDAWPRALHALQDLTRLPAPPPPPLALAVGSAHVALSLRQPWGQDEERFASASEEEEGASREGAKAEAPRQAGNPGADQRAEGEPALPDAEALWAWREERWPCAATLVQALLRGRALLLLVPPAERLDAERAVRALAHFVARPAALPAPVEPWRTLPLSVAALGHLRLAALPPALVPPPVRRVALVLPWELRRSAAPFTPPPPPPLPGSLALRLLGGALPGPQAYVVHVEAQLSEALGAVALAFHALTAHVLQRGRPATEPARLHALDEALGGCLAQLRVGGDDAAVLRNWLQVLVGESGRLDLPSRR